MRDIILKATEELYLAFDKLNKDYYYGELPDIVITIQSSPKGKAYGWFWKDKWVKSSDESVKYHELNISAEYLNRPIEHIISTVQHEMIHLYCHENSIQDTSNNNVYHNKRFKIEAEKRGLIIEQAKTIGWSVTTPTEEFKQYILNLKIKEDVFTFFRAMKTQEKKSASVKTTKYVCPVCGATVRGEEGLEIVCKNCNVEFEFKQKDE